MAATFRGRRGQRVKSQLRLQNMFTSHEVAAAPHFCPYRWYRPRLRWRPSGPSGPSLPMYQQPLVSLLVRDIFERGIEGTTRKRADHFRSSYSTMDRAPNSPGTSSPKPKRTRVRPPKPRTQILGRGRACLNCRELKIRCDGVRPICGNCVRVPKRRCCSFSGPGPQSHTNESLPSNAYSAPSTPMPAPMSLTMLGQPLNDMFAPAALAHSQAAINFDEEPSDEIIEKLLRHFIPHAAGFGFFLDITSLWAAPGPRRSLRLAAALWGAHLSLSIDAYDLVRRALDATFTELSWLSPAEGTRWQALQTIQAQILISRFLLLNGQRIAAKVVASAAEVVAIELRLPEVAGTASHADSDVGRGWHAIVELQALLSGLELPRDEWADAREEGRVEVFPVDGGYLPMGESAAWCIPPAEGHWEWDDNFGDFASTRLYQY
ncbi:hypothetical protein HMN09_00674000 [Mycena chlorophos]|uniref:Zn(2)-C6 fungal-type domain-containing protein n=1 Tax=Mycena chlorophos TaxID=658473 RepID=A0A8H6T0Z5_MYCCL|nr:hypothetical protein HMN09_00674000 [Mycena chlorophos]